jgi:hypothetical protein
MKIRLPITFELPINDERLQDLQIELGLASQRHEREAAAVGPLNATSEMIGAFLHREDSRKKLWSFLDEALDLPEGAPFRLKGLLILSILCKLFEVEAKVRSIALKTIGPSGLWTVEVQLADSKGKFLGNWVGGSASFDPSDHSASFTAFLGAVADEFRESARSAFGMTELYDDQDIR